MIKKGWKSAGVLFVSVLFLSITIFFATGSAYGNSDKQVTLPDFYNANILSEEEINRQLEFSEEVIRKHKRYREANNLDSSDEAIKNALTSTNARETITKYSIALTEEEEKYIQERDGLMEKYGKLISSMMKENGVTVFKGPNNEITERYSNVGTFYQEKANGLKFVVSFSIQSEQTDQIRKAIEEIVPPEYLEFRDVDFSEAELVKAYEDITTESKELSITLENVIVDIKNNIVEVQVEDKMNANRISINSLKFSSPGIYKFEIGKSNEQPEARTTKLDTMVGGLLIADSASNSTNSLGYCSIGTSAKKNGDRFIITAGHCLESWSSNIYQGGEKVGTEHYQYDGDYADVGVIQVTANKKISNYVYKYSWTDGKVTSYQSNVSSLDIGDNVCLSGATTGFSCGEITALNANSSGNIGFIQTDIDSAGGDSGGTYWYNNVLIGIHTAGEVSGTPFTRFTHIANAIAYGGAWTPFTSNTAE